MDKPWLEFYDKGIPYEITVLNSTLYEELRRTCSLYPNNVAIQFPGYNIKYKKLLYFIDQIAIGLQTLGLRRADVLSIILPNIPQFIASWFAAQKIGAVVSAFNPLAKEAELAEVINKSTAKIVITLNKFAPLVYRLKDKTQIQKIITSDIGELLPFFKSVYFYQFKIKSLGQQLPPELEDEDSRFGFSELFSLLDKFDQAGPYYDSTAALQFTGGTTGVSKGAMLTHRNILNNYIQIRSWMTEFEPGKEIFLAVLPFFHIYGLTAVMVTSILSGSRIILLPPKIRLNMAPRFDAEEAIRVIEKRKVTIFNAVPMVYDEINKSILRNKKKVDFGSLKFCISGGAPLPKQIRDQFKELTGIRIVEGYGLSEASPVTHISPFKGQQKTGSIGIPIPSTNSKIFDINDPNKEKPVGEQGELAIKGPQVMKGYWDGPEETEKVFHNDGWLLTGDIAVMDSQGFFFIVDRKKELIKGNDGRNIYPSEIENVLRTHPAVKDVMVKGIKDPERGEVPKAFINLKENSSATAQELINFCRDSLSNYKVPREIEFREKPLPRSPIGKAMKREL